MSTYLDTVLNGLISEPGFEFTDGGPLSHGMFHSLKANNVLDFYSCWDLTILSLLTSVICFCCVLFFTLQLIMTVVQLLKD